MVFMPFNDVDVHSALRAHMEKISQDIRNLDNSNVLRSSPIELEQFYLSEAHIEPIQLDLDAKCIEEPRSIGFDAKRDPRRSFMPGDNRPYHIPGTQIALSIPFTGDSKLWRIQPSTYSMGGYPEIDLLGNQVYLTYQFADDTANSESIKRDLDQMVARLAAAVDQLRKDIERHNASYPSQIKGLLETKRGQAQAASGAVSAIGIPIRRRDQPATFVAPIARKKLPVHRPDPTPGVYRPEPELIEPEYQHILSVMRSLSLVIERNPESFATLDEEGIRDHILLQLNGHYEGAATGETFNRSGKTDILIRVDDRNIFIGECKFWHGSKKCGEAVDQLLSYLTWRDCKTALVVFNKQKDSAGVARKLHETMTAHPSYRKAVHHDAIGNGRYVFVKASDPGREIIVHTLLFDLPTKD